MHKLNQKGVGAVEGLLILVIVAIVGGTGYFVYNAQNKTKDTLDSASLSSQSPVVHKKKAAAKKTATFLAIKEWGVKIALSGDTQGAYYKFTPGTPAYPDAFLDVMAPKADAITGSKGTTCKGEYIAKIMRLKKDDPLWDDPQFIGASSAKKDIGIYRYSVATLKQYVPECFNKGTGTNYEQDTATYDQFHKIADAFVEDFKTIQAE
jgi:hypothetical protein